MSEMVEYLGHRIDSEGLHIMNSKVEAISMALQPRNVQELRSFSGLLHYYGKFLPGLATLLHPLNHLLKAGQKWTWTKKCTEAFVATKKLLVTAPVLGHYDPSMPMKMAGSRCLSIWHRGSEIPCAPGWEQTAHCICISNLDHH